MSDAWSRRFLSIVFALSAGAMLAGCDTSSQVEFMGDRRFPAGSGSLPSAQMLTPSGGGYSRQLTPEGRLVDLSVGSAQDQVQGTTSQGFRVRLDIQGSLAQ